MARRQPSRREFLRTASAAAAVGAAGVWVATREAAARAAAVSANEQLAVGVIGVANRGRQNIDDLLRVKGVRIVALCDVSERNLADASEVCPTRPTTPIFARCWRPRSRSTRSSSPRPTTPTRRRR
jgi:hypothetical protein